MAKDAATPAPAAAHPFHYFRLVPAANGTTDRSGPAVTIKQSRRQQLARRAASSAEDTMRAVDTVRAFDRTGNISDALPHLIASAEATLANARALAADIERALPRPEAPAPDDGGPSTTANFGGGMPGGVLAAMMSGGLGNTGVEILTRSDVPDVSPALLARRDFERRVGRNRA